MPAIDLHDIAQALKCVKGEPDRQDDVERRVVELPAQEPCRAHKRASEKREIFENKKNQTRGNDTDQQQQRFCPTIDLLQVNSRCVIDDDRQSQDQDVDRDKRHVEHTARDKQQRSLPAAAERKIQGANDRKKQRELDRIEKHGRA
jgi:hypothetical protein